MNAIKKVNRKQSGQTAKVIPLRVVHSKSKNDHENFIQGVWMVAYSSFWNSRQFSLAETKEFKRLIAEHFETNRIPKQNFKDLVQRICLAKRFVARKTGRYISKPVDWLNINYCNGLAGTTAWLDAVNEQRQKVPHYNEGIAMLAAAILKYIESPSASVYYRFRTKLIEQKQFDLLQIFQTTILNLQYLN